MNLSAARWLALVVGVCFSTGAFADNSYCTAMSSRLPSGEGAAFLASYEAVPEGVPLDPSLGNAAFVYDNALAAIALAACGDVVASRRIADAIVVAGAKDRFYADGRIRNAYRAGLVETPALLPGWWGDAEQRWLEEPSQVGTSMGNVAWAALALLNVYTATGEETYRSAAARIMSWVAARGPASWEMPAISVGYTGGTFGHEPEPTEFSWRSTEHNIDLAATFGWLAKFARDRGEDASTWETNAAGTRAFVGAMWNETDGRFAIGTDPAEASLISTRAGLDAQLWPVMAFPDAPATWQRALAWAEARHAVEGGFDFNDDRDGVWLEGTAQAALLYRLLGQTEKANAALAVIGGQRAPSGLVFATNRDALTTGLAVSPQSGDADFVYHRWPHLGATAWAALAEAGWNPFTGQAVGR